jgi:hypothetical protein
LPQNGRSSRKDIALSAKDLANGLIACHKDTQPFDNMEEAGEKTNHRAPDQITTN